MLGSWLDLVYSGKKSTSKRSHASRDAEEASAIIDQVEGIGRKMVQQEKTAGVKPPAEYSPWDWNVRHMKCWVPDKTRLCG